MKGLGTVINVLAVLAGGGIGLLPLNSTIRPVGRRQPNGI